MKNYFFVIFMFSIFGCNSNNVNNTGKLLCGDVSIDAEITFNDSCTLETFRIQYDTAGYQYFQFYNNGALKGIAKYKDGKRNGITYYFYQSGIIKHKRYWQDTIMVGFARDYFDTTGNLKALLVFNELGQLYYKKSFKRDGTVLKIEGEK